MTRAHPTAALALAAAAALAPAAAAQPTFEPRIGFRNDHSLANPTPNKTDPFFTSSGSYEFSVLFGAFNAQGFTNRGMFNFVGTMTLHDSTPGGSAIEPRSSGALIAPYSFGNVHDNPTPTTITFDANRGAGQVSNIPWNFGDPPPSETYTYPPFGPGGASGAPDTYHPGFRFHWIIYQVWDPTRPLGVEVTGTMQAITSWHVVEEQAPEPGVPGFQSLLPGGFVEMPVHAVLGEIPAPGAGAAVVFAGLAAMRRRRA